MLSSLISLFLLLGSFSEIKSL